MLNYDTFNFMLLFDDSTPITVTDDKCNILYEGIITHTPFNIIKHTVVTSVKIGITSDLIITIERL